MLEASFRPPIIFIYERFIFTILSRYTKFRPCLIPFDQPHPQPPRLQRHQKHENAAHDHTFHIVGLITIRIESRTHQGSELTKEIQHNDAGPSLRVRILVVDRPGKDKGYRREETCCCRVDTSVSPFRVGSEQAPNRDGEVTQCTKDGMKDYVVASIL